MQISNASLYQNLSQYGGSTNDQTTVRAPARPVIIEGQVLNDKDKDKRQAGTNTATTSTASVDTDNRTEQERFELQGNEAPVLINPPQTSTPSGTLNADVLYQPSPVNTATGQNTDYSAINRNPAGQMAGIQSGGQNAESGTAFPYSNRRSLNGLSGGALIVQSYLSNAPSATIQQNYNNPVGVDYYI